MRRAFPKKSSVNTSVGCWEKRQGRLHHTPAGSNVPLPKKQVLEEANHPQVTGVIRGFPKSNPTTKGPGTELSRLVLPLLEEFLGEKQSYQRGTELTLELSGVCALMASRNRFGTGMLAQEQNHKFKSSSQTRLYQISPESTRFYQTPPDLTKWHQDLPDLN